MDEKVHVLAISVKEEVFIWKFFGTEEGITEVLKSIVSFASNPELPFTWYDAVVCSTAIRQLVFKNKC